MLIALLQEIRGNKGVGADDEKEKKQVQRTTSPDLVEKVAVDWFKKHMISSEHDEEKQMALASQLKHLKVL